MTLLSSSERADRRSFVLPLVFVFVGAGLLATPVQAQEEAGDGSDFFVLSENQVPFEQVDEAMTMMDTTSSVILDQLVDEGLLKDWGVLRHSWGNKWNLNFYYVTESHAEFVTFWDEYMSRRQSQLYCVKHFSCQAG